MSLETLPGESWKLVRSSVTYRTTPKFLKDFCKFVPRGHFVAEIALAKMRCRKVFNIPCNTVTFMSSLKLKEKLREHFVQDTGIFEMFKHTLYCKTFRHKILEK